jgi:hypothetical protein
MVAVEGIPERHQGQRQEISFWSLRKGGELYSPPFFIWGKVFAHAHRRRRCGYGSILGAIFAIVNEKILGEERE